MNKTRIHTQQNGFVAIFSVLIIMGILTLLTVGFTRVIRQAQFRTLNDHLNSQAFYAAESGVNMAASVLSPGVNSSKTQCQQGGTFNYVVDGVNNIAVSCLLIDDTPTSLEYSAIPVIGSGGEPPVSRLSTNNGDNVSEIVFNWDSHTGGGNISNRTSAEFLPIPSWATDVGVLRVDLVPDGQFNRSVADSSYTFYLYPSTSGVVAGTVNSGLGGQGQVIVADCDSPTPPRCTTSVTLNGFSSSSYYMRLSAYYNPLQAGVSVVNGTSNALELKDGQVVVDSTGKANDVYRRIQVRLPIDPAAGSNNGMHDVFSIFSGVSICKRYVGIPGDTQVDPPCQF